MSDSRSSTLPVVDRASSQGMADLGEASEHAARHSASFDQHAVPLRPLIGARSPLGEREAFVEARDDRLS